MTKKKLSKISSIEDIFNSVKDEMNAELIANGFKPIGFTYFKRIVKRYWKTIMDRVIYKYDVVEIWKNRGTLCAHKIMCTNFNPHGIDVNKTDGYFYFIFWDRPKCNRYFKLNVAPILKKRQYQNVVLNGGDYPEIMEESYVR